MRDLFIKYRVVSYAVIVGVMVAAFSFVCFSLDQLISVQESAGARINISGRQRMLSQRIALLAKEIQHLGGPTEDVKLYGDYLDAVKAMDQSHHGLVNGDKQLGLAGDLSASMRSLYFGPNAYVDRDVKAFLKVARDLFQEKASDDESRRNEAGVKILSEMARGELLADLDAVVRQDELESASTINALRLRTILTAALTTILIAASVMALSALLIKRVRFELGDLKKSAYSRKNIMVLIFIIGIIAVTNGAAIIGILYNTAFEEQRSRLIEAAQSRARLIEAMARFDKQYSNDYPGGAAAATLAQIRDAHDRLKGFGETGEFMMARRDGDRIVFILRHRDSIMNHPETVPFFHSNLAEPMRQALQERSGSIVGLDYRGAKVLAAYEPVAVLNLGIVVKINLSEIRMPFVKATAIIILITLVAIILGAVIFYRISNPVLLRLSESENRLADAQRLAHIGSWQWDIGTSQHSWSEETYRILGVPPGAPPTQEIFENTIHPDDRERVFESMANCLLAHSVKDIEYRIIRPNGEVRYMHDIIETIGDKMKPVNYVIGTIQDITERRLAEEEVKKLNEELEARVKRRTQQLSLESDSHKQTAAFLQDSKARLAEAQRMVKLGNWEWNMLTDELVCSDEAVRIFDLKPRQGKITRAPLTKLVHPEDRLLVHQAVEKALADRTQYDISYRIVLKDGTVKHIREQGEVHSEVKSVNHDDPVKIFSTVQDITEQVRRGKEKEDLEEQLRQSRKMESLGQLAGGIAHEFNNMLVPIVGITEMIVDDLPPGSPMREDLGVVMDAADKARKLVQQILAFSRVDKIEMKAVDIADIFQNALKLLRATIPTTIEIEADVLILGKTVMANSTEIHQAIMNLGTNACHAIGKEHGTIKFTLEEIELHEGDEVRIADLEPGRYVKLTVRDTGCGMDEATLERIFDPFFTTKEVGKGTGMGLPMVLGSVKGMGGAITVSSKKDEGTTFEIYLPLIMDNDNTSNSSPMS
ncbi:MAG: hypothetical protein A3G18_05670 [Rhodospirillales bacterium RIFCSPLOWO2_12_FULL_58_28]|nr:MAG: hypothetical protein A3H92_00670 [Rhodospirillales bacterium RIFCSPLOWO2_02_FULL_58_16]OHC79433.1 MAG: hypothetical protein A3G18_05670 [Rhodospirillales bacterium RIFCSPLOWO2_12_FULL_58_28]